MNIPATDLPRVLIIGCGFAGLRFARSIDTNRFQVVLFDKNNYHTFQPLMYQVATSGLEPDSIVYPIRKVFGGKKNFYFRLAEVERVDVKEKTVLTSIGELCYDHLIMCTGATNNFFGMDSMRARSMPMKSLTESLDLRSHILQNLEAALNTTDLKRRESLMNFVIVGAGATGVELAGALSELKKHVLPKDYPDLDVRRMQIHLVEAGPKVLGAMSTESSARSESFLRKLGVHVWLDTKVLDFDGQMVQTDKEHLPAATLIWSAGVQGAPVEGLAVEMGRGRRVPVDEYGKVIGLKDVWALGDVALMSSGAYPNGHPMLASVAGQMGDWVAKNFNRRAQGKAERKFQYKDKGTMATVGRHLAVVDLKKMRFGGAIAWYMWMFVHLMLLVDYRSRLIVFMNWLWSYIRYDRGMRLIIRRKGEEK